MVSISSLHLVKNDVRLSHMAHQARDIADDLDLFLDATHEAAPQRMRCYKLHREERPLIGTASDGAWSEVHWEEALFRYRDVFAAASLAWSGIVTYQVLLRDTNADAGWGEIDLLGVSLEGLPVIIELKTNPRREYLLRAILEAVSNAVAFRKAWPATAAEWSRVTGQPGPSPEADLPPFPIVCAAPTDYWRTCIGQPGRRQEGQVFPDAWPALHALVQGLGDHGFPVHFVEIEHRGRDARGLPWITGGREVALPYR